MRRVTDDEGAGSVLSIALLGSVVCGVGILLPLVGLLVVHGQAQAVSDQAALSAADALNGITWGEPCDIAQSALGSIRASAWTCQTVGGDAYISGDVTFGPLTFGVKSRAGNPDD